MTTRELGRFTMATVLAFGAAAVLQFLVLALLLLPEVKIGASKGSETFQGWIFTFLEGAVAFGGIWVAGMIAPVRYRAASCWIITTIGLVTLIYLAHSFGVHGNPQPGWFYLVLNNWIFHAFTCGGALASLYYSLWKNS
jgi:hypothetical protein